MTNNTQPPVDSKDDELSRLKHKLLYDWFIHEESCDYSMTGSRECDCVQSKVADNVLPLIKQYGIQQRIKELEWILSSCSHIQITSDYNLMYMQRRVGMLEQQLTALKSKETPS